MFSESRAHLVKQLCGHVHACRTLLQNGGTDVDAAGPALAIQNVLHREDVEDEGDCKFKRCQGLFFAVKDV